MIAIKQYVSVAAVLSCFSIVCCVAWGVAELRADEAEQSTCDEFALQHWVVVADDVLHGSVQRPWNCFEPLQDVQIRVLSTVDSQTFRTQVSQRGQFEIRGISPGAYVVVASGNGYYASFTVHLMRGDRPGVPKKLDIPLARATGAMMREFALRHLPTKLAGKEPNRPLFSAGKIPENAEQRGHPAVVLDAPGSFSGKLWLPTVGTGSRKPAAAMTVQVRLEEKLIATTTSDADGNFRIADVRPGFYTFAAAGEGGFVTFGIELVSRPDSHAAFEYRKASSDRSAANLKALQSRPSTEQHQNPDPHRKLCPRICCEVLPLWEVVDLADVS